MDMKSLIHPYQFNNGWNYTVVQFHCYFWFDKKMCLIFLGHQLISFLTAFYMYSVDLYNCNCMNIIGNPDSSIIVSKLICNLKYVFVGTITVTRLFLLLTSHYKQQVAINVPNYFFSATIPDLALVHPVCLTTVLLNVVFRDSQLFEPKPPSLSNLNQS